MSQSFKGKSSKTSQKGKSHTPIRQQTTAVSVTTDKDHLNTEDNNTATNTALKIVPETPKTIVAAPKDAIQDKSAMNKATNVVPGSPQTLIAYVHNLSPIKRNKRNTIDYTTLTLQTGPAATQPALCYSKSKRKILEEKETTRSPIKITRYTKSTDKAKIVINDKTIIAAPEDLEYNFQYSEADVKPVTPLENLSSDDASVEDNITVCAKVVKI